MTILLGLLAALSVGTSDFLGGLASRRADPIAVTASSNLVGVVLAGLAALVVGGEVTAADVGWGLAGGAGSGWPATLRRAAEGLTGTAQARTAKSAPGAARSDIGIETPSTSTLGHATSASPIARASRPSSPNWTQT